MKPTTQLPADEEARVREQVKEISFVIPGIPIAQPRPRTRVIAGHAQICSAPSTHAVHSFKAAARMSLRQAYGGAPLQSPLYLGLTFVFPRPKGMFWKKRPMPRIRHTKKPDCDNIVKSLADSLIGSGYIDDSQVAVCYCEKFVASGDEQPHVKVVIKTLESECAA